MKQCLKCLKQSPEDADFCINCGQPFGYYKQTEKLKEGSKDKNPPYPQQIYGPIGVTCSGEIYMPDHTIMKPLYISRAELLQYLSKEQAYVDINGIVSYRGRKVIITDE